MTEHARPPAEHDLSMVLDAPPDAAMQLAEGLAADHQAREKRRRKWVFWLKRTRDLERFGAALHRNRHLLLLAGGFGFPLKQWWRLTHDTRLPFPWYLACTLTGVLLCLATPAIERGLARLARTLRSRLARLALRNGVDLHGESSRWKRKQKTKAAMKSVT